MENILRQLRDFNPWRIAPWPKDIWYYYRMERITEVSYLMLADGEPLPFHMSLLQPIDGVLDRGCILVAHVPAHTWRQVSTSNASPFSLFTHVHQN